MSNTTTGTKRQITFDPLGWLAPVVITFKMWIQRVWLEGKDWNDPLPQILIQVFQSDKADLTNLTKLSFLRRFTGSLLRRRINQFIRCSNSCGHRAA